MLVLHWHKTWWTKTWLPGTYFENGTTRFEFTTNKKRQSEANIVLFRSHELNRDLLACIKKPSFQHWYAMASESPHELTKDNMNFYKNIGIDKFIYENDTGDYQLHRGGGRIYLGDLHLNYSFNMYFNRDNIPEKNELCIIYGHEGEYKIHANKDNLFSYSSFPYKSRGEYLLDVMKYYPYHSFGRWKKNVPVNLPCGYSRKDWQNKLDIIKHYKFTAALNNALENTYEEKIFQCYLANTIPIISEQKTDILPSRSFISIHDYPNGKKLANYLEFLANNKDEYNKYFEWKKNPDKIKKENPEFYKMIITMELPCFLINLYNNKSNHICSEKCMENYNAYYKNTLLNNI